MAMNGTVLGNAIVAAIQSADPSMTPAQIAQLKTSWIPIATAIVIHIQTTAIVSTTDTVTSNGATGAGTPGGPLPIISLPGTGTGTGTVM